MKSIPYDRLDSELPNLHPALAAAIAAFPLLRGMELLYPLSVHNIGTGQQLENWVGEVVKLIVDTNRLNCYLSRESAETLLFTLHPNDPVEVGGRLHRSFTHAVASVANEACVFILDGILDLDDFNQHLIASNNRRWLQFALVDTDIVSQDWMRISSAITRTTGSIVGRGVDVQLELETSKIVQTRQAEEPKRKKGMTLAEASEKAGPIIAKHQRNNPDVKLTLRQLAVKIDCSDGLAQKTPAWTVYNSEWNRRHPPTPKAVGLTDAILATQGSNDEALESLMNEQREEIKFESKLAPRPRRRKV